MGWDGQDNEDTGHDTFVDELLINVTTEQINIMEEITVTEASLKRVKAPKIKEQNYLSKTSHFKNHTGWPKINANCKEMEKDITASSDWTINWQLNFNEDRAQFLHMGRNNPSFI